MLTTREALEAALVRTPDDTALHMAYADCLIEEGDPRGEWIRLCLDSEEAGIPKGVRTARKAKASRFKRKHQSHWFGEFEPLASELRGPGVRFPDKRNLDLYWLWGWLTSFECQRLTPELISALRGSKLLRLLWRVVIAFFQDETRARTAPDYDYSFLRDIPASSVSCLSIHDRYFDDAAIEHLIAAPFFPMLTHLGVSRSGMTERGMTELAKHPQLCRVWQYSPGSYLFQAALAYRSSPCLYG